MGYSATAEVFYGFPLTDEEAASPCEMDTDLCRVDTGGCEGCAEAYVYVKGSNQWAWASWSGVVTLAFVFPGLLGGALIVALGLVLAWP